MVATVHMPGGSHGSGPSPRYALDVEQGYVDRAFLGLDLCEVDSDLREHPGDGATAGGDQANRVT